MPTDRPAAEHINVTFMTGGTETRSQRYPRWRDAQSALGQRTQLCPPQSGDCCRRCMDDEPSVAVVHDTRACQGACSRGSAGCLAIYDNPQGSSLDD